MASSDVAAGPISARKPTDSITASPRSRTAGTPGSCAAPFEPVAPSAQATGTNLRQQHGQAWLYASGAETCEERGPG
jgi:hypothetical protein